MEYYIIDGNNLIGKVEVLYKLQKKNKQMSREKAAFLIDNYFIQKNYKGTLHFDGFENLPIKTNKVKIVYSGKYTADEKIKKEIEDSNIRTRLVIVTADSNIIEFAKVCGCKTLQSDTFGKLIMSRDSKEEEQKRIDEINNNDEFKRLFDV